jgi:hypothetical protein
MIKGLDGLHIHTPPLITRKLGGAGIFVVLEATSVSARPSTDPTRLWNGASGSEHPEWGSPEVCRANLDWAA